MLTIHEPAIELESASVEPLEVVTRSRTDPTVGTVEFQVTPVTDTDPGVTWVPGSWEVSAPWDTKNRRAIAITPTIGAAGLLTITEGDESMLWARFGGNVVHRVTRILAT